MAGIVVESALIDVVVDRRASTDDCDGGLGIDEPSWALFVLLSWTLATPPSECRLRDSKGQRRPALDIVRICPAPMTPYVKRLELRYGFPMCSLCAARPSSSVTQEADGSFRVDEGASTPDYLAVAKHLFRSRSDANRWSADIQPDDQRRIFSVAHSKVWREPGNALWGACVGLPQLGAEPRQRLAKFPAPPNDGGDEHGYPVSGLDPKRSAQHRPPSVVIDAWTEAGLVNASEAELLRRGKL